MSPHARLGQGAPSSPTSKDYLGSPTWCIVVKADTGLLNMEGRRGHRRSMKPEGPMSVRASISFPPEVYELLEQLARRKKVSLAWVVRDAVERYVAEHNEDPKHK